MSFGWSAGDIFAALTLAYNLIEALDSVDGAAGDYREATTFLRDLRHTLEPLAKFPDLSAYPNYGEEISQQAKYIKEPVETFLRSVTKYDTSLGQKADKGRHRHIIPKLKWHALVSKRAISLKQKIHSHMRVIDTLLQRLTLEVVLATEMKLPHTLRTTLQEMLRPELISILQEHTRSCHVDLDVGLPGVQTTNHSAMNTNLDGYHKALSMDISALKREMEHSTFTQRRIESSLRGAITQQRPKFLDIQRECLQSEYSIGLDQDTARTDATMVEARESLQEVFCLVLLYLGHFLKNVFDVLSRIVEPSRALMPVLLAKYNISFLDAIGSPPRILPIEFFRSFNVLQEFIRHEFKTHELPGRTWVDLGRYQIISLANNQSLNEATWSGSVGPGTTVAMSMVVRTVSKSSAGSVSRCPERNCTGNWMKPKSLSWATCPECHKEVLTSEFSNADVEEEREEPSSILAITQRAPIARGAFRRALRITPVTPDEDDISLFKRIVQEVSAILEDQPQPGASGNALEITGVILGMFPLLISASEHYKEGFEPLQKWKRFRTDFISFINSIDVEKAMFDATIHRLLMLFGIRQKELENFMLLPEYEGWQNSDLAQGLKKLLGPSYSAFSVSIREIYKVLTELMSLVSLEDGRVSWASDSPKKWDYQLKRIRLSFSKKGAKALASLEFHNRKLRELLDHETIV